MDSGLRSLADVQHWLSNRMMEYKRGQLLGDIVDTLQPINRLPAILTSLINDGDCLAQVAGRSYNHRNGFDRISLCHGNNPQFSLRLHIWWAGDPEVIEDVHGHPWDFGSVVLHGELYFEQYVEDAIGDEVVVYAYPEPTTRDDYSLVEMRRARISRTFVTTMRPGTRYSMSQELLHRVFTTRRTTTMTLMLSGPVIGYPCPVYSYRNLGQEASSIPIPRFSPECLAAKLDRAIGLIE